MKQIQRQDKNKEKRKKKETETTFVENNSICDFYYVGQV